MKKRMRLFVVAGALIASMAFGGAAMAYPGGHNGNHYSNSTHNYSQNHMQHYSYGHMQQNYGHMQHNGAWHNFVGR